MKKTLVAVAALVATGAFAEVTLSGNIDQGFETTTVDGVKTTGLGHSNGNTFFTLSGNEDVGSGLKASFKIEQDIAQNSLASQGGGNREAWVGLSGAFGEIKAGKQYTDIFGVLVAVDPAGFNNIAGWGPGSVMLESTNSGYNLLSNNDTISYTLPKLVDGLTVNFQSFRANSLSKNTVTGGAVLGTDTSFGSNGTSYAVHYAAGGLFVGTAGRTAGADKSQASSASYNFGVAKVAFSNIDSTIGDTKTTDNTYYVSAPLGDAVSVAYSAGTLKVGDAKTNNSQMGAYYNLSKRTQLFGIYGKAAGDTNTTTTSIGVNHSF